MDLDEWEYISDEGFLEIHDDGGGNKIFSRKHGKVDPNSIMVNMNYFICPSPTKKSPKFVESTEESKSPIQIVPVPIQFHQPTITKPPNHEQVKQIARNPTQIIIEPNKVGSTEAADSRESASSQVFFKKTEKANEFVDMKLDSPKSGSRGIIGQMGESMEVKNKEMKNSLDLDSDSDSDLKGVEREEVVIWRESNDNDNDNDNGNGNGNGNGGLNMWKWGLSGIGAICSFGVAAAATVCIIILGSGNKQNHHKIRFQIYEDDKRLKQVVRHATKLNEAISTARGVPLAGAHITYGGYFDAL